ncbi:hypothetical protein N181_27850 [Sinorhizobium fredii USDA 205]|nr:hypothetical protein N181_27850 [Sinorhizobium fredii USDA 205]
MEAEKLRPVSLFGNTLSAFAPVVQFRGNLPTVEFAERAGGISDTAA